MIKTTYVTFLVDKSTSMQPHRFQVPKVFEELSRNVLANAQDQNIQVRVNYFGEPNRMITNPFSTQPPTLTYLPTDGSTAIRDAIGETIEQHLAKETRPRAVGSTRALLNKPQPEEDIAHLIVVVTDGEENSSYRYTVEKVRQLQALDNVTLVLSVPQTSSRFETYGVPVENIQRWDTEDVEALETQVSASTVSALKSYTTARSTGVKKVTNFYATTDLSGVSSQDLAQCQNMTSRFKPVAVSKEQRIDEAVVEATGKPYIKGTAFYQLTKREEIQAHKDLLLTEKGKKTIYGGPQVRTLLNLPQYQDGKVTPGNHANFDIFVQSTSDNRKLVRGTRLLVVK